MAHGDGAVSCRQSCGNGEATRGTSNETRAARGGDAEGSVTYCLDPGSQMRATRGRLGV